MDALWCPHSRALWVELRNWVLRNYRFILISQHQIIHHTILPRHSSFESSFSHSKISLDSLIHSALKYVQNSSRITYGLFRKVLFNSWIFDDFFLYIILFSQGRQPKLPLSENVCFVFSHKQLFSLRDTS